jgi:hypothetical protein
MIFIETRLRILRGLGFRPGTGRYVFRHLLFIMLG